MKKIIKKTNGISLPITLFVLMGLLLSISVLIRSSDVSVIVSGNVTTHSQLSGSNSNAVAGAIQWLNTNSATLDNDNTGNGYFSSQPNNAIDYTDANNWSNAYNYNSGVEDSYKNISQYKILRMCTLANTPYNGSSSGIQNVCSTGTVGGNTSGKSSFGYDMFNFGSTSTTAIYFKILTRTCIHVCSGMPNYNNYIKNGLIITETIIKM